MKYLLPLLFVVAADAQTPPESTFTVSGRVLDADTNTPISGAVISVHNNNGPRPALVQTDETGAFQLANVKPPAFQLSVAAPGYVSHRLKSSVYSEPLPDKSGPINVSLYLQREAVIEGDVLDEAGKPIAGSISLYRDVFIRNKFQRRSLNGALLTASGRFRITKIEPGDYWVYFIPTRPNPRTDAVFASTYYPDPSGRRTLHLSAGQTAKIELRIRAEKGFTIKGKLLAKVPLPEIRLRREALDDLLIEGGILEKCDKEGVFTIQNLPAGVYIVEGASSSSNVGYIARKKVTLGPNNPIAEVILESPLERDLAVRFLYESGEPAPTRCCAVLYSGPSYGGITWDPSNLANKLYAGSYNIEINSQDYPVLSVRQGKVNGLVDEIIIPAMGPVPRLEIVVGPKKPLLTIYTTNSAPVFLDILHITPQGFEVIGQGSFMAIPANYKINGIAIRPSVHPMTTGQYYIFARANSLHWPLPLEDPLFFQKYRPFATPVTILQGEAQNIILTKIITPEAFNEP